MRATPGVSSAALTAATILLRPVPSGMHPSACLARTPHYRQVVPPVVDRLSWPVVGAIIDATMLANDLSLCDDHNTVWINPWAYRSIGEGHRDAVAIALQMHDAGRRDTLGVFDEPIERPGNGHERGSFFRLDVGNGATYLTVWGLRPVLLAALLEPIVQASSDVKRGTG